ncbi:MAG: hypothetical protein AAFX93_01550 [Verrucomicrobiota bacterium]
MSSESVPAAPEAENKSTQINLGEVVNNYLEALQRVHDVMNYSLAAERMLSEQEYENFSRANRVMPSQKSRMDYTSVKREYNTWLLKQTLNEVLGVLVLFLDDCRTISTLSNWKAGNQQGDIQKTLQDERMEFARMDLPSKIGYLKEKHSISSPSEEHILSIYQLRRALANKGSVVSENDVTGGKLTIKLRSVQLKTQPGQQGGGVFVTSEVGDMVRELGVGDFAGLNKNEHLASILTVAFFITTQAQSLKEFAERLGVTK